MQNDCSKENITECMRIIDPEIPVQESRVYEYYSIPRTTRKLPFHVLFSGILARTLGI